MLTQAKLKELLSYNPLTGVFTWKQYWGSKYKAGDIAGTMQNGYIIISLRGYGPFRAHRLAWLYVHGVWPQGDLDHKNRNKVDNALHNLREASRQLNTLNRGLFRCNKTGVRGVFKLPNGKYRASITRMGKTYYGGEYVELQAAAIAVHALKLQHD